MPIYNSPLAGATNAVKNIEVKVTHDEPVITYTNNCSVINISLKATYVYSGDTMNNDKVYGTILNSSERIIEKKFEIDIAHPTKVKITLKDSWIQVNPNNLNQKLPAVYKVNNVVTFNGDALNSMFETKTPILYKSLNAGSQATSVYLTINSGPLKASYGSLSEGVLKQPENRLTDDVTIVSGSNPLVPNNLLLRLDKGTRNKNPFYHDLWMYEVTPKYDEHGVRALSESRTLNWDNWQGVNMITLLKDLLYVGLSCGLTMYVVSNHGIALTRPDNDCAFPKIQDVLDKSLNSYFNKTDISNYNIESTQPFNVQALRKTNSVGLWDIFLMERANNVVTQIFQDTHPPFKFTNIIAAPAQEVDVGDATNPSEKRKIEIENGTPKHPSPFLYRFAEKFNTTTETIEYDPDLLVALNLERGKFDTGVCLLFDFRVKDTIIPSKIHFDSNSDKLNFGIERDSNLAEIDRIAKILFDNPQIKKLLIRGHTDSQSTTYIGGNQKLSEDRAQEVFDKLLDHPIYGLNASSIPVNKAKIIGTRLAVAGYADKQPIYRELIINKDTGEEDIIAIKNARTKNRRVDFKIIDFVC